MFHNRIPNKTGHAQCLIEQYQKETQHDSEKRCYYFPMLFSALNHAPTPEQLRLIGYEASNMIFAKDAFFVQNLMHRCNHETDTVNPDTWKQYCSPTGYDALLICGTAHPNGYLREACLKRLTDQRFVLQFILIRMNDWVPAVRRTAWNMTQDYLRNHSVRSDFYEVISAMPFVEYVRRGQRAQRNADFSMDTLDSILMRILANANFLYAPVSLRRLCYKLFRLHPEPEYRDLILNFIRNEHESTQRFALVHAYLYHSDYPVSDDLLDTFMHDPYWRIRLDAYEYRMKHQGIRDGLEKLLLSPSYPIREFAAYHLEKNGFDTLSYCREHLPESMLALSDFGGKEDAVYIRPYLETHPTEALIALVRLGEDESKELVWKAMQDSSAGIAKKAYRLAQTQIHYTYDELLPKIKAEPDPVRRLRLIRLLGRNAGIELLPILMKLAREYTHMSNDILELFCDICNNHRFAHYAVFVTKAQKAEITEALHDADRILDPELRDHIIFLMREKDE